MTIEEKLIQSLEKQIKLQNQLSGYKHQVANFESRIKALEKDSHPQGQAPGGFEWQRIDFDHPPVYVPPCNVDPHFGKPVTVC